MYNTYIFEINRVIHYCKKEIEKKNKKKENLINSFPPLQVSYLEICINWIYQTKYGSKIYTYLVLTYFFRTVYYYIENYIDTRCIFYIIELSRLLSKCEIIFGHYQIVYFFNIAIALIDFSPYSYCYCTVV